MTELPMYQYDWKIPWIAKSVYQILCRVRKLKLRSQNYRNFLTKLINYIVPNTSTEKISELAVKNLKQKFMEYLNTKI
jgi:hypothetical protein